MSRLLRFKLRKTASDIDHVLADTVASACGNSPAYRQICDEAGVDPGKVRGIHELALLPVVSKETLFRHFSPREFLHRGAAMERCVVAHTSGMTGLPLSIFMSRAEATYRRFLVLRAWWQTGRIRLPLTVAAIMMAAEGRSSETFRRGGLVKVVRISMETDVEEKARLVRACRPQILTGNPTSLELLAEVLGTRPSPVPSLRLVATRGEVLHTAVREELERAFACPVVDFYSTEEFGIVAAQCPEDPEVYHVNTDACVLEIVDDEGNPVAPETEGRVVVTNLFNRTMPFIRYDLEDRGALLRSGRPVCACGSGSPRMAVLSGRDDDFILLPDGKRISPRAFGTAIYLAVSSETSASGARSIRGFQAVQDALDHVTVRIVPEQAQNVDFQALIDRALRGFHPALRFTVELVERVEIEPSGKLRKAISRIGRDAHPAEE